MLYEDKYLWFCLTKNVCNMTWNETRAAYLKSIEDALLEQGRNLRTKEDANKLIESLGIAHLFVPIKKAAKKKTKTRKARPKGKSSKQ